jgi:hypothetical protein
MPSRSQTYYPNDATVNSTINGSVVIGRDSSLHNSSPTFNFLTGGYLFNGALDAYNSSTVNMSGGLIYQGANMHDNSLLNFSGGVIEQGLSAADNSVVHMTGGSVTLAISSSGNSKLTISGGYDSGFVFADTNQSLDISGGTFAQSLNSFNNSTVNISGGDFSNSGGLYASDNSVLNFYGTNLSSILTNPNDGSDSIYTLSGTLKDGTTANGVLVGLGNGSAAQFHLINITPEPGTVSLLAGLGMMGAGVLLRRLRRARRTA